MLENGEIVGTFALFLGEDESYRVIEDGAWHLDQPYGTIHRLASNGKARGVSKACFDFCTPQIGYLRADTHADNRPMQRLLEAYGFRRCGVIHGLRRRRAHRVRLHRAHLSPFPPKVIM